MADFTFQIDPAKVTHFKVTGLDQFGNPIGVASIAITGADGQTVPDANGAPGFTETLTGTGPTTFTVASGTVSCLVEIDPTPAVLTKLVVSEG